MEYFNKWLTFFANIGVLAGIIFLGAEIQQNTAAVQGATYQAMSDAAGSHYASVSQDELLSQLTSRIYSGEGLDDFSDFENIQLYFHYFAIAQRLENSYLQYQAGLVDDRVFDSYGWHDAILLTPHFKEYWNFIGKTNSAGPEFNAFFEARIGLSQPD